MGRSRSRSRSLSPERRHRKKSSKRRSSSPRKKEKKAKSSSSSRRRHRHSRRRSDSDASSASSRSSSSSSRDDERTRKKQRRRAEKVLASFGYTNETNPFGDSNLTQPFVWRKKYEDDGRGGTAGADDDGDRTHRRLKPPSERELKRQQLARVDEIRKARERRAAREREQEEMERLRTEELRLRDAEQYQDWQAKEEEFHRAQAKVRSKLRIRERREKPIDVLAKNLLLLDRKMAEERGELDDDVDDGRDDGGDGQQDGRFLSRREARGVEHRRPERIIEVLAMDELEGLETDIPAYMELEASRGAHANHEFWRLVRIVTRDRIRRLGRSQRAELAGGGGERGAIHDAVHTSIHEMLDGKSVKELETLKAEVEGTIERAPTTPGTDVEYWEEVAQQIEVYKARARLAELHEDILDKLGDLLDEQPHVPPSGGVSAVDAIVAEEAASSAASGPGRRDDSAEARAMEHHEAEKGLEGSEERLGFSDEVAITALPAWSEKYQPRKPRYFNRVKTGYDWNKYNQTHYDHENPPPKVVQGYKFNLFYPDLLDKTVAPRYFLEKTSSSEFCIIRFSAGPPYQDIAFKIVNREWEYSHKRGFKSVFERGILHLYFNFKRHRYRR